MERQSMAVDIACVGFGPAMAGFLTTLSRRLAAADRPPLESATAPGMPLQVVCYERADDPGFGVSGVVTRARGIRAAFPELDPTQIPMAATVREEKVLYLLDPVGASPALDGAPRRGRRDPRGPVRLPVRGARRRAALRPRLPPQARRVRLLDRAVHAVDGRAGPRQRHGPDLAGHAGRERARRREGREGRPARRPGRRPPTATPRPRYMPGMDVMAALTVVGDGPVGAVGRQLDRELRPARRAATAAATGRSA